ncbi:hypothetical protein [Saccharothrix carnea]|uniref:hypothetical protein n=1 Tax=Saccharothrix carnea TaxID=1280637 RepID=UPI0011B25C71|nr:hypothetical protein [Saccharothrix carnea]
MFEAQHSTIQLPQFERRLVPYEALFEQGEFRPWGTSVRNLVPEGRVSFEDFAARTGKTVILGDPGAGKSTTSTLLARQAFDRGRVPFVSRLKNVDVTATGSTSRMRRSGTARPIPMPRTPGAVRRLLVEGQAFLVFDDLDETNSSTRSPEKRPRRPSTRSPRCTRSATSWSPPGGSATRWLAWTPNCSTSS